MFYTKPTLTTMCLVQSEAVAATPWEVFTSVGTILDGQTTSYDAKMSGTTVGGAE